MRTLRPSSSAKSRGCGWGESSAVTDSYPVETFRTGCAPEPFISPGAAPGVLLNGTMTAPNWFVCAVGHMDEIAVNGAPKRLRGGSLMAFERKTHRGVWRPGRDGATSAAQPHPALLAARVLSWNGGSSPVPPRAVLPPRLGEAAVWATTSSRPPWTRTSCLWTRLLSRSSRLASSEPLRAKSETIDSWIWESTCR